VADLLDVLNRKTARTSVDIDGALLVYWHDRIMGRLLPDDPGDLSSWCYYPTASQQSEPED
jgi:hypothetical protein